ncbi:MAG: hypothetical protein JW818_16420 [Pirellulales bacterium]|nr:hypothetical protein [Pirellulales bacterium]
MSAGVGTQAAEPSRASAADSVREASAAAQVDIGAFARVVTSDPNRMKGTTASHVKELPAKDVFLETDLLPDSEGIHTAPVTAKGSGCIGLRWHEMRFLGRLELHWADPTYIPSSNAVQLQYWVGMSPWQGEWKPLVAKLEKSPRVWSWRIADKDQPAGTYRVRWEFAPSEQPVKLKKISAFSRSSWTTAEVRVERQQPAAGKPARIVVTNGRLLEPAGQDGPYACSWDTSRLLELRVRYSKPQAEYGKSDRTLLRFELAGQPVSVAVEDVVAHERVYVPSAGLFVSIASSPITLEQYRQRIAERKTVLETVRERPDQTLAQAMAKNHIPLQNSDPIMLSLAADNRKFVVHRDGSVSFLPCNAPDGRYMAMGVRPPGADPATLPYYQVQPRFAVGGKGIRDFEKITRRLDGGWLPMPVTTIHEAGVEYRQRTYVAPVDDAPPAGSPDWYRDRAVCVIEYTISNSRAKNADASLDLAFFTNAKKKQYAKLTKAGGRVTAIARGQVLAVAQLNGAKPLGVKVADGRIRLAGSLPPGGKAHCTVFLPAWKDTAKNLGPLKTKTDWARKTEDYWKRLMAPAMWVDTPDALLNDIIRASQVHCWLAARCEKRGEVIVPWIGSVNYPFAIDSEGHAVIRGMDMMGNHEFLRRGMNFYALRTQPEGYLTTGYVLVGTGENLWTAAEHFERTGDRAWLEKVAPRLVRMCKWIVAQRKKTKKLDARGEKVPEYGLMPPGVSADWRRFAYRYFNDAQYCHGLEAAAKALAQIGHPDSPALLADARQYREDVLRSYRWMQARSPVVPLGNGTWAPNHPAMVDTFGNVDDMISPAEDSKRTWIYSVELGAHHLAATGLINPRSAETDRMLDYLEDFQFLRQGWEQDDDYCEARIHKDVFNLGGFAKNQPYYARNAELYAMRDDVKPFVRSYFNTLCSSLDNEIHAFWECPHGICVWNKTHETGWFLAQTAVMLAMDRDGELWLAPMVTNQWLKDGMKVSVHNAPTRFGKVSYTISSSAAAGHIDAEIQPPTRERPKSIVIRIRHPEGKTMRAVTVNGKPHSDFDARKECVRIPPTKQPVTLRVEY